MKKEKEYMKFISEHQCKILKETDTDISVTKYKLPNKFTPYWFLCIDGVLNGIAYCPYCGSKLDD